jgi:glutathione S-transferase
MKILSDATTPFGRKAVLCAIERGIAMDEEFVAIDAQLDARNPLRQIPVLETATGEFLYDSDTIIAYLDTLHSGTPLLPGEGRFELLTRLALANGVIEAVLLRTMESRRPDGERSATFMDKLEGRALRGIARLEREAATLGTRSLNAIDITTACALEYADFRFSRDWRAKAPALGEWLEVVAARASMVATVPVRTEAVSVP